jgi:MoaA/NifB/PqqE/SkfB family radical SAM enzyme
MHLTILYRGSLVSCNYGCAYCPFAKRQQTNAELAQDRAELERFADWIEQHSEHDFSILFTPWGEALIHPWYQKTLARLSHLGHVQKVAIQTNLSGHLSWLKTANPEHLAFWTTFHPEWSDLDQFLAKCQMLDNHGFRLSVGVVGFPRFKATMTTLRQRLPAHIYLWINAVKAELPHLSPSDRGFFQSIDPLYELNTHHYPSLGQPCQAGASVIAVDGTGTIRRCHFIPEPMGNLYESELSQLLEPRPCSNDTCHCHIGYVHLDYLELSKVFGSGILERIPNYLNNRTKPACSKC